ncbi:MAG: GtrA family protein [Sphaerochaetaceae bacterium]|nr:GtrA family protein [Sphaerochaetaceae bacterium]
MSEFFALLKKFDLKGIFITPTTNGFLQFFRYVFVGGLATIVDWGVLYLFTSVLGVHYLVSSIISFTAGLLSNFLLSKLLVFKASEARVKPWAEFLGYALIGVVGLGLTEIILYFMTDYLGLYYMISKAVATVIVLVWNYVARKKILYK